MRLDQCSREGAVKQSFLFESRAEMQLSGMKNAKASTFANKKPHLNSLPFGFCSMCHLLTKTLHNAKSEQRRIMKLVSTMLSALL